MEWTSLERSSVYQLFKIVYWKEETETWKHLLRSTSFLSTRPDYRWQPWQAAQVLIIMQTRYWSLGIWRDSIQLLRRWQLSNPNHSVTLIENTHLVYDLCCFIAKYGTVGNRLSTTAYMNRNYLKTTRLDSRSHACIWTALAT